MPNNVNFQIPFLGGGPAIADQIMAGLHQGFSENQAAQELKLKQQQTQNETARTNVLNQLTRAQIEHEANVAAFEKETNPIKKSQMLTDLQDSALKLGIAKHQAAYFGIDADALTKAATPEGITPPTPTGTGATPASSASPTATPAASPTPFEQEMSRTEKLLGPMTPDEQTIWQNAKSVAQKSMSAAPITAAIGKISENRQAIHKAELETTPFKDWKAQFTKEHGREPNAKEVQDFQTAGQALRIQGMENLRQDNYLDTTTPGGGTITAMTAGEFAAANKEEPGRFVKATTQVINANKATGLINDIHDGVTQMRAANAALPDKGLSTEGRALLALAAKHPESATQTVMAGLAATKLSEPEQDYLIAHATLAERAMALRGLQGQGAGSDSQRAAIVAMLPGFATADKKMGEKQLKTFENNVANVERTIPKVGKMSQKSAGESQETGGPTAADLLKKYPPATQPQ
jgi:hypothetical protein